MPGIGDIFFNGIKNITEVPSSEKQSADGNQTLASMKNGETFQAKVVSSNGLDVTLKLSGGETVNARLSSNMALAEGQTVSFEVKNSGTSVSISPLLTNTSADISVLKALDFAQIPVTNETSAMTTEMMRAGLPIDRSSLLSMYENVRNNPGADITNIIDLTKLGIEVNETSLNEIESYKNLSYQIDEGMQTLSKLSDKALLDMVKSGNEEGATGFLNTLASASLEYVSDENAFTSSPLSDELKEIFDALKGEEVPADSEKISQESGISETTDPASRALELLKAMGEASKDSPETAITTKTDDKATALNTENRAPNGNEAVKTDNNELPVETGRQELSLKDSVSQTISLLREYNQNPEYKPSDIGTLLKDLSSALEKASSDGNPAAAKNLINSNAVRSLVQNVLKDGWRVSPSDVADKDRVESLYKRLNDHLSKIGDSLAANGAYGSEAFKAADNMKSNVDFLNQVNQMYAYIQLPLKLSDGDTAHGDLYVYSNKKNMISDDSTVTAFLHLDMDNLGPVDVYVSMDVKAGGKVTTNFTVADDDTLELLNSHMDQLTDRLKKRGYDISCKMKIKGEVEDPEENALAKGGVNFLLMHAGSSLSNFSAGSRSFDVRA